MGTSIIWWKDLWIKKDGVMDDDKCEDDDGWRDTVDESCEKTCDNQLLEK